MEKFYNREKEIAYLQEIEARSEKSGQFTVVTGRRLKQNHSVQIPSRLYRNI